MLAANRRTATIAGLSTLGVLAAAPFAGATFAQPGTEQPQPGSVTERYLDHLAEALGIDRATLGTALDDSRDKLLDDLVAEGRITAEQAERAKSRARLQFVPALPMRQPLQRPSRLRPAGREASQELSRAMWDAMLDRLGLTDEQLREGIRAGQTLEQLAAAQNATIEQLQAARHEAARTTVDQLVEAGAITAEQGTSLLERLTQARRVSVKVHRARMARWRLSGSPKDRAI